ncbi:MAG: hypothetical protein EOM83_01480 [Clostridia bacterium]|nr:hypothetical protein [Clostridia bacterium]
MMELITLTGVILSQANKLMENPAVGKAVDGVVNWIGNILGKKSATDKLEQIQQQDNHTEEAVNSIKANLEFMLEDNKELQAQLAEKVAEVQQVMQREGMQLITKTNTMTVTGDSNVSMQDINSQGNISIGR